MTFSLWGPQLQEFKTNSAVVCVVVGERGSTSIHFKEGKETGGFGDKAPEPLSLLVWHHFLSQLSTDKHIPENGASDPDDSRGSSLEGDTAAGGLNVFS